MWKHLLKIYWGKDYLKYVAGWILTDGTSEGWLVGWGLTALLTQNRSYRACRFVGIFYSKL